VLEREPSKTAFATAAHRAAHQVLEEGAHFKDPLAVTILGVDPDTFRTGVDMEIPRRVMRFFIVARANIAEAAIARGVEQHGVTQLVVLGAGLDTFAYRNPFEGRLKVFEVDHPATQAWKRRRLAESGIAIPPSLNYAPVDFERQNLTEQLTAAGLDPAQRTVFSWLGVVPYLTGEAITSTLSQIATHPGGAEVVFDYSDPPEALEPAARAYYDNRAARVAAIGEPFLSHFAPDDLHRQLHDLGFADIEDLDMPALVTRVTGHPNHGARKPGGHVLFAAT